MRQAGARLQLHQLAIQALRAQETAPADFRTAPDQRFTNLLDVSVRRIKHRIDNEGIARAEGLKLFKFRNDRLGRPPAVSGSLNHRVRAVAAAVRAAALRLEIQNAPVL